MPVTWEQAARSHPNPYPNNGAYSKMVQASTIHILRCGYTNPQPLRAVCTTNPSPFPGSNLWSLSFSTQLAPVDTGLWLGSAGEGRWPSVQVSLHASCYKPVPVFFESLEAPSVLADLPTSEGTSWRWSPFPISFFLLLSYPVTWEFLGFFPEFGCLLPVFSRYSLRINPYVDVFLINLWEEVSFMFTTLSSWFRSQ